MKTRKLIALLLAAMLLLAFGATASAAVDADTTKFIQQMEKLDAYLMYNRYSPNVGAYAVDYLSHGAEFKGFDVERLNKVLTIWLGCSSGVRLETKLAAYAQDLGGGYRSISTLCALYSTPEAAAEAGSIDRKNEGIVLEKAVPVTPRNPRYSPCREQYCAQVCR